MSIKHLYIVGHPVAHSKSPVMYNALYAKLGLPWEYGFMDILREVSDGPDANNNTDASKLSSREADYDAAFEFLLSGDYLSVNITTPYKPQAFEAAEIKAASAKLAKGVNLLVNKNRHKLGYNVDGIGCVGFLEHAGVSISGASVVVCGTGPTALAILHAAAQAGAKTVTLLGRDKERSRQTLEDYLEEYRHLLSTAITLTSPDKPGHLGFADAYKQVDYQYGAYETSAGAISRADIIIDATVLGMKNGDPAPFDTSLLHEGQVVLDTVYGHGETTLIRDADSKGCITYDGAGMLVSQAVHSAIIVCEIEGVDLTLSYDEVFDIMSSAAGFSPIDE